MKANGIFKAIVNWIENGDLIPALIFVSVTMNQGAVEPEVIAGRDIDRKTLCDAAMHVSPFSICYSWPTRPLLQGYR